MVLKRYIKISSCSEGLSDATASGAEEAATAAVSVASRYENPYASLDVRAGTTPVRPHGRSTDAVRWPTVDNARHLPHSTAITPHDATDLRNNNRADDYVTTKTDDVIAAEGNPDGNANHFGTSEAAGRVSPPRLKRREKAGSSTAVVQKPGTDDEPTSETRQTGSDVINTPAPQGLQESSPSAYPTTADEDESGYSTLSDILGQVQRAMLEHQHQLQMLCVAEDHADSDLDTSGDCRDIDLEQAGRSKSTDDCEASVTPASAPEQQPTPVGGNRPSNGCETTNQTQREFKQEETQQTDLVDVNRNRAEMSTDGVQSCGEVSGAVMATSDLVPRDYDVPRSTPVRDRRDLDDGKCHGERRARPPPPPPPNDDNAEATSSSTPLDGTPRSQTSSSTLTQQKCGGAPPQTVDEPASVSTTADDNLIRVELSGEVLTVSEPTHMSWEEVMQSAHVLGIPLQPHRPAPTIMTRSDSAAVRRSSTSSSVTSSDRSFVSSPMNSPGARCRTSAPPVVLPRHLVTRRAVSSSPSTKQTKPKKTGKGASPFREKLHSLFARKGDDGQTRDRGQCR